VKAILIVEDSTSTRAIIRNALEGNPDYEILEVESGFEALRVLPTKSFDLILTDINMPDINGLELINFVKSNPTYRDIPLIIVTTERSEEDRKRGLSLGAVDYVTKPFESSELRTRVEKALET